MDCVISTYMYPKKKIICMKHQDHLAFFYCCHSGKFSLRLYIFSREKYQEPISVLLLGRVTITLVKSRRTLSNAKSFLIRDCDKV